MMAIEEKSYEFPSTPGRGPLQDDLTHAFNEYRDTSQSSDRTAVAHRIAALFVQFECEEAPEHNNPAWAVATLRAGWAYARGDFIEAGDYDLKGLVATEIETRFQQQYRAMSARNLSWIALELDRPTEAIAWASFANAIQPHPRNDVAMVIAWYSLGNRDRANALLELLIDGADFNDKGNEMATHLRHEKRLHSLDLPAVQRLQTIFV